MPLPLRTRGQAYIPYVEVPSRNINELYCARECTGNCIVDIGPSLLRLTYRPNVAPRKRDSKARACVEVWMSRDCFCDDAKLRSQFGEIPAERWRVVHPHGFAIGASYRRLLRLAGQGYRENAGRFR